MRAATRLPVLDRRTLARGVVVLSGIDPDLAAIAERWGPPPLWVREPGFATLVTIILGQQVSLAAAGAILSRLQAVSTLTPRALVDLGEDALRAFGFSRRKALYCIGLAQRILGGELDLDSLGRLEDADVRGRLMTVKGVGPWTADIYLLSALRRPDAWPCGDLALAVTVQEVKRLGERPTPDALDRMAQPWRPWRAIAARMLWHHYLSTRGSAAAPTGAAPV